MKNIIKKSFIYALTFFIPCYSTAINYYDQLYNVFIRAQQPALYQARVVNDLANPVCFETLRCICNLVLEVDKAFKTGKTPDYNGIINNAKNLCSADILNNLKQYVELKPGESNETFLKKLYNKSLIIKDVTVPVSVKNAAGFNATNLKDFLNQAIRENKLFDSGLTNITITDIKSEGGYNTQELFRAKNNATQEEWIIKGIADPKREAFALSITAQTTALAPIIQPNSRPDFPILSLPIAYLGYTINNKKGVLAVMRKASGKEFFQYMKDYVAAPNDINKNNLNEAYKLVGTTLGNFHREYPQNKPNKNSVTSPTYTHGDLHARNIFVDLQKKQVYWIDNENIGRTIYQPQPATIDWEYVFFVNFNPYFKLFGEGMVPSEETKRIWAATFYPTFINAYLDTFGAANKPINAQHMGEMLINNKPNNRFWDDAIMHVLVGATH